MNFAELNKQIGEVVRWNNIAQNGVEDFCSDKLSRQLSYVIEEAKETVKGSVDFDLRELADGVADVFVTLTYAVRVAQKGTPVNFMPHTFQDVGEVYPTAALAAIGQIAVAIVHSCTHAKNVIDTESYLSDDNIQLFSGVLHNEFALMMSMYERYFGHCPSVVIRAVLDSNWSKFVKHTEATTPEWIEAESKWIEQQYDVTDVVGTVVDGYIVFRDDGGKGKIRKPSTYLEPQF